MVPAGLGRDHDQHRPIPSLTGVTDDFYAILGVPRDASQAEISAASRSLLRHYHPDTRAPGTSLQDDIYDVALQQVLTAYETLRDPARRSTYDEQTASRPARNGSRVRVIRVRHAVPDEGLPFHAGPVHWRPGP